MAQHRFEERQEKDVKLAGCAIGRHSSSTLQSYRLGGSVWLAPFLAPKLRMSSACQIWKATLVPLFLHVLLPYSQAISFQTAYMLAYVIPCCHDYALHINRFSKQVCLSKRELVAINSALLVSYTRSSEHRKPPPQTSVSLGIHDEAKLNSG